MTRQRQSERGSDESADGLTGWVSPGGSPFSRWAGWLGLLIVVAGLFAGGATASYEIAGRQLGTQGWPEPLGWITRVLAIESVPTSDGVDIRWVVWAVASLGLFVWLVSCRRTASLHWADGRGDLAFNRLAAWSVLLVLLSATRSAFAALPLVAWAWTWQLGLSVSWMLLVCACVNRVGPGRVVVAIGLSAAALAAVSWLFCAQAREEYPNWPTGNVLLTTSICLAGVFMLGTWLCGRARRAWRERSILSCVLLAISAACFVAAVVVLVKAGRRAAIVGLVGGAGYLVLLRWLRARGDTGNRAVDRGDATAAGNDEAVNGRRTHMPRLRWLVAAAVAVVLVVGVLLVPRLMTSGRWQSVQYRAEMYKATLSILADRPAAWLVGIGPGHLCFDLTARMRPLHAESPRVFHGQIADHAHSEPLEALAELGAPMSLLYLALPLVGLAGFAAAYRRSADSLARLPLAGAGAALAAVMMAEATSLGLRQPGCVAMLLWALVGAGWASGAGAGWSNSVCPIHSGISRLLSGSYCRLLAGPLAAMMLLLLMAFAWMSQLAAHRLYEAKAAWSSQRYVEAARLLDAAPCVPSAAAWMDWLRLKGCVHYALMQRVSDRKGSLAHQATAMRTLARLVDVCPAYLDSPVWLARATDDPSHRQRIIEEFLRYDPYDAAARLEEASREGATPIDRLTSLRLALRNACVTPTIARAVMDAAADASAGEILARWLTHAESAATQHASAEELDPLTLETLRLAIIQAGQQGDNGRALHLANRAADVLTLLSHDSSRMRLESVEMEVHLDQAWFGWRTDQSSAGRVEQSLLARIREQPEDVPDSFSQRMAAQLAAMLLLGEQRDADQAADVLFRSDPTIDPDTLRQMQGVALARWLTLTGLMAGVDQIDRWDSLGRRLMGNARWDLAKKESARLPGGPWWLGVLRAE